MNKKIKVAQIIGIANNGGVESCIMNYFENINKDEFQFDFYVESTSKIIDERKIKGMGGNVVIIPHYTHILKYIRFLKKLFKINKYDIVHSNMNALSFLSLYAAKKAGVKVRIAHSHSATNKKEFFRTIIKKILKLFSTKYATDLFACSELAGKWLFGEKRFNSGQVTIIHNAIDINKFFYNINFREDLRMNLGINNDKFVIGHIGRFVTQKNHIFLLKVFAEFQKSHNDVLLLLFGEGPLENELKNETIKLGISDKVLFCGVRNDIWKYYNLFDVFLLPSLYEGLGMVGIEAQLNGLNVVCSKMVPKEVQISETVYFLEFNILQWCEYLNKIYINKNRKKCEYVDKYDIKVQSKNLENIYTKLINKN